VCCERIAVGGHVAIICGLRRSPQRACAFCDASSTKQCDYPVATSKTCDAYMCDSCSIAVGENVDYCLGHSLVAKKFRVVSGRHAGHEMLILAWRKVRRRPGVRQMVWRFASQCSCSAAGDMDAAHLELLDLGVAIQ
jgi:hypothetical protein